VKRLGIAIVTQPNFVTERGDAYRSEVAARDLPHLYRVRSWLDAGVAIAGGTDAPFGRPDPWSAMQAAVRRETRSGEVLAAEERVSPETALSLFTKPFGPAAPGWPATGGAAIAIGRRADLCLLDAPWRALRDALSAERVVTTLCGGKMIWPETP
jgi:predicted amidohydrolase YtcJ